MRTLVQAIAAQADLKAANDATASNPERVDKVAAEIFARSQALPDLVAAGKVIREAWERAIEAEETLPDEFESFMLTDLIAALDKAVML